MHVDELIQIWRGPLVGLIASWGAPWRDASELALDTFAEAWMARGRFVGEFEDAAVVGPWLRGIAFRLHANWYRRRRRTRAKDVHGSNLAAPVNAKDQRLADVRAAIDRLPGPQRTAILMHYLEETSVRETAALLGVTEKVVEGRLYRARKRLAELLGDLVATPEAEERS